LTHVTPVGERSRSRDNPSSLPASQPASDHRARPSIRGGPFARLLQPRRDRAPQRRSIILMLAVKDFAIAASSGSRRTPLPHQLYIRKADLPRRRFSQPRLSSSCARALTRARFQSIKRLT